MAAQNGRKSSKKSSTWRRRRLLTRARLLTVEALLIVGIAQTWFEDWLIEQTEIPGWAKIAFIMILMAGALGFLLIFLERVAKKSLASAQGVAQAVPLPWSSVAIHLAVIALLFWLYGVIYRIQWLP